MSSLRSRQGRDVQAHHVQAVKEVAPERALLDGLGQVAVGGGHEADVHRDYPVAADLGDLALLHGPQQLGLHLEGNVADFVKKQGAVLGQLELAHLIGVRPGEGSLDVAEELAFKQGLHQGAAVHGDKGPLGPGAELVDLAGDDALAGAGLPGNEHGGVGARHPRGHIHDRGPWTRFEKPRCPSRPLT